MFTSKIRKTALENWKLCMKCYFLWRRLNMAEFKFIPKSVDKTSFPSKVVSLQLAWKHLLQAWFLVTFDMYLIKFCRKLWVLYWLFLLMLCGMYAFKWFFPWISTFDRTCDFIVISLSNFSTVPNFRIDLQIYPSENHQVKLQKGVPPSPCVSLTTPPPNYLR